MDFEVILDMNLLFTNHALVDYYNCTVTFGQSESTTYTFTRVSKQITSMISTLQAKRLLNGRCQGYLMSVIKVGNSLWFLLNMYQ